MAYENSFHWSVDRIERNEMIHRRGGYGKTVFSFCITNPKKNTGDLIRYEITENSMVRVFVDNAYCNGTDIHITSYYMKPARLYKIYGYVNKKPPYWLVKEAYYNVDNGYVD